MARHRREVRAAGRFTILAGVGQARASTLMEVARLGPVVAITLPI